MAEALFFPKEDVAKLEPYLPAIDATLLVGQKPFVTLTFATSLDSSLSLAPGVRTALSGPQSKAMTHYLRSRHDAICVGVGTAVADDPGLNCRIADDTDGAASVSAHQPRPIVIDPHDRWPLAHESRVLATARRGQGLAPYIVTAVQQPDAAKQKLLESHGGKYIILSTVHGSAATATAPPEPSDRFRWDDVLDSVASHGLRSIMIEGGGNIINTLLEPTNTHLVRSVIVTIAPVWLGRGGVMVSPNRVHGADNRAVPAARLADVKWQQLGEDVVLCGRFNR
ncbi:riboflavin biosynthesis protein [Grosmannia clavigera kw1407]|uniref:2,5-diamino-6-ribosylamino-4(3H)-pyrimidinone 5'-phosphate reductase n=1 Tax=Grosmannia clavigera (strain kw1407 / UAMH 11150) TaxID=655863 RepID=F0XUU7_GROCL|nr:riboflavin biosynthesis protein [Grosmannia clavigera kw1407]EFW98482.1 riboflavin biosynthesis protein [Grosmannia clavigera kw1407]